MKTPLSSGVVICTLHFFALVSLSSAINPNNFEAFNDPISMHNHRNQHQHQHRLHHRDQHQHQHSHHHRFCDSFPSKYPPPICIQLQSFLHYPPPPPPLPPAQSGYDIDPRYGVEKRLVPSGPNPLHN
ncbi:hypothetical protein Nepgr_033024 [Nepenthes gracilis]|uniref:Uncharacterized protein n=1 Tax=Nepenthes gracilis TaxID=150966 RepID=A0AAD3TL89_NEPGR|nr:hypothetical protein Nepgr_033024 [Nepenthes gracilis]